ncbi:hypothetical protein SAMN06296386_10169 [Lachnospiraceae bacterium]|nr:hypothetical protein SAMN06296386_10169 [Lachnospiraceae bacterium]
MKDYYTDDLAEETGRLFFHWAEDHLDMDKMITQYMSSHFRENVDKRYAKFCTQMWYEMAEQFESVQGDAEYDVVLCDWLGNFYTYLQAYTGKSSKEIIGQYPFQEMYMKSNVLHDLDMELAVKKVAG